MLSLDLAGAGATLEEALWHPAETIATTRTAPAHRDLRRADDDTPGSITPSTQDPPTKIGTM